MLILIGIEMIFWHTCRLLRFQRISRHIDQSDRADRLVFVPKVKLDEHVGSVACWVDALTPLLLKVIAVMLDALQ